LANNKEILAYITDNKERVLSGDPLTLFIEDEEERKQCVRDLGIALRADVVLLKNGDTLLISR